MRLPSITFPILRLGSGVSEGCSSSPNVTHLGLCWRHAEGSKMEAIRHDEFVFRPENKALPPTGSCRKHSRQLSCPHGARKAQGMQGWGLISLGPGCEGGQPGRASLSRPCGTAPRPRACAHPLSHPGHSYLPTGLSFAVCFPSDSSQPLPAARTTRCSNPPCCPLPSPPLAQPLSVLSARLPDAFLFLPLAEFCLVPGTLQTPSPLPGALCSLRL